MTVRIQKDALNLREELADLRKPSGIAGEALLRADSVQEQRDLIGAGRKNLIINGGFDVWQRGTSQSSNGYGCADRWAMYRVTNGAQRSTDVPSSDFKYSMQYTSLTTGMADLWLRQSIEDYGRVIRDTSKTFTVSFWAKADRIGVVMVDLNDRNHGNITVGTAWQKYSHTFTGDASNAGDHAALDFGSNENAWTINITGIQFELGSVATEFEHRPFGEELALCQRYFYQMSSSGSGYIASIVNRGIRCMTDKIPSMRGTPTLSYDTAQVSVNGGSYTNVTPSISGYTDGGNVLITLGAGSNDEDVLFYGDLKYDAEL